MLALGTLPFALLGAAGAAVFSRGAVSDFLVVNKGLCVSGCAFSTTSEALVLVGDVGLGGAVLSFLGITRGTVSEVLEPRAGLCDEGESSGSSEMVAGRSFLAPPEPGGGGGLLRDLPEGGG